MIYNEAYSLFFVLILFQCQIIFAKKVEENDSPKFPVPQRYQKDLNHQYFQTFDDLKKKYKPVDLGLGELNYSPPKILQSALAQAATSDDWRLSQYSPPTGLPRLLKAVSNLYSKLLNRYLDPDKNILITVGATEALYDTFQAYTFPEDEWIVFEPHYFLYVPMITAASGVPRFIPLRPTKTSGKISSAHWTFDKEELSNLFNNKTKGIIVNSPNNPIGKVFTLDELSFIADLSQKWNTLVVLDEVYQFLTFDNKKHIEIASLPGMFERTITIGSAGKIFGAAGYRIGWAYGASNLISNLKTVHIDNVIAAPSPNQEAMAIALEKEIANFGKPESFLETFKRETQAKRNYIYRILSQAGMTPILPEGGYYIVANWTTMTDIDKFDEESSKSKDYQFDAWLVKNLKIYGLPGSMFYSKKDKYIGEDMIRFTMTKKKETLMKAGKSIKEWIAH